jgi:hypothetical protein
MAQGAFARATQYFREEPRPANHLSLVTSVQTPFSVAPCDNNPATIAAAPWNTTAPINVLGIKMPSNSTPRDPPPPPPSAYATPKHHPIAWLVS